MIETARWWLVLQIVALAVLPLCVTVFARLPDRGYALSKPFGLLILGYAFWLANSLHLVPNSRTGIVAVLVVLAMISLALAAWDWRRTIAWAREHAGYIAVVEGLLLLAFVVAVVLRTQVGQIVTSEQPSDFMLLNAATRASHFPPQDPWLSGHTVAYYYFGYVIIAMTGRLAFVPTDIGYNIGVAMTAALTVVAGFGVVYNLVRGAEIDAAAAASEPAPADDPAVSGALPAATDAASSPLTTIRNHVPADPAPLAWRPLAFGFLGAMLLAVFGNLVFVLHFASAYGIGGAGFYHWIDIENLQAHEQRATWYPSRFFAFFDTSRLYLLQNDVAGHAIRVITEFPIFSFVLGDLHPHVMALPYDALAIGVALTLVRHAQRLEMRTWRTDPALAVVVALVVGALGFLNTWDLPTMTFVLTLTVVCSNALRQRSSVVTNLKASLGFVVPLLALAVIAYLPFYVSFNSQADGVWPVVKSQTSLWPGTRPVQALLHWGPLFVIALPYVAERLWSLRRTISLRGLGLAALVPVSIVVAWAVLIVVQEAYGAQRLATAPGLVSQIRLHGSGWITDGGAAVFLVAAMLCLWHEASSRVGDDRPGNGRMFTLLLITTALLLIFGSDFFYVGDIFNNRINTVFKLYYQAWLLLALADGYALYEAAQAWRRRPATAPHARMIWAAAVGVTLAAAAVFPIGAIYNRTRPYDAKGNLLPTRGEINGIRYLPVDEQAAIAWLIDRAQGQHFVIVETVRDQDGKSAYSFVGRMSADSGVPTVLGWPNHEDQWRGGNSDARGRREADVSILYSHNDLESAMKVVRTYGVKYIIVGAIERKTYNPIALAKFDVLPVAFKSGNVTIYDAQASAPSP